MRARPQNSRTPQNSQNSQEMRARPQNSPRTPLCGSFIRFSLPVLTGASVCPLYSEFPSFLLVVVSTVSELLTWRLVVIVEARASGFEFLG